MTRGDAFFQFCAALIVFFVAASFIRVPGYMDAEYYTLSAKQLATGKGLTEPILWNYLDDPSGLPHPSHTYWMPAPAMVGAAGMLFSGMTDFQSARLPFLFFAALAAPAAGWMGFRFSKRRTVSWLAGGLAIFSGFYLPYAVTTDSFFLIMGGGWLFLYLVNRVIEKGNSTQVALWLAIGGVSGWMHLNRADGLLWLAAAVGLWLYFVIFRLKWKISFAWLLGLLAVLTGYFVITGFWYYRNLTQLGNLLPPNASRALWMTSYNELFAYPPELLTFEHWSASGFVRITTDRLNALTRNLMIVGAVQGLVFMVPLWAIAIAKRRQDVLIRISLMFEIAFLLVMSLVFPYSGLRGGFLHSSAALMPVFWGLAAAGVMDLIQVAEKKLNWRGKDAEKVYFPGVVLISAVVSLFIFQMVVIGSNRSQPAWESSYRSTRNVLDLIAENGVPEDARIFINNPAGFALESGGEAIVIPDGNEQTVLAAAKKFQTNYLVLEINHVDGLNSLYKDSKSHAAFSLLGRKEDALLFRIQQISEEDH